MGILRADRVSGLGGANAINGSVKFKSHTTLNGTYLGYMDVDGDIRFGDSDFTIECWIYPFTVDTSLLAGDGGLSTIMDYGYGNTNNATNAWWAVHQEDQKIIFAYNNSSQITSSNFLTANTWHHIAISHTRQSNQTTVVYGDGTSVGSISNSQTYNDALDRELTIGNQNNVNRCFEGYISNVRIVNGTALYTAAFTPPTTRLDKTSDTVILACQSPGNVIKEGTGKVLTIGKDSVNDSGPLASHFAPDVGEDHGTTFEDNTKFDTLSYMVPPGGTTTQRGRGRGVLFGGSATPSGSLNTIQYIDIQSSGNSIDFGDLACGSVDGAGAGASSTRGVFWGSDTSPTSKLDYVTIATTANATSFGTSSIQSRLGTCMSSETRAVYVLGGPSAGNVMEYVTIATTGNTTDFGDQGINDNILSSAGLASPTRGIVSGGYGPSPYPHSNTIEYITIATTGNGQDFGDLNVAHSGHFGVSSTTRGVFAKGYTFPSPSVYYNTIEYITIASTGNTTDFGDATNSVTRGYSHASHIRGVFAGGINASGVTNTIDYITIATTGNAIDWGDISSSANEKGSGTSDCHGGIS